jgi:hypothetical protein
LGSSFVKRGVKGGLSQESGSAKVVKIKSAGLKFLFLSMVEGDNFLSFMIHTGIV